MLHLLVEEYQFKYQKLGSFIPTDERAGADTCWYQEMLMGVGSAFGAGWRSSCITLTNKYEGSMVAAKVFVFLPVLKQVDRGSKKKKKEAGGPNTIQRENSPILRDPNSQR